MNIKKTIIGVAAVASSLTFAALPMYAATNSSASASAKMITRANTLIDQRVKSLNDLITRIQEMKNVTPNQKATITGNVQSLVTNLTDLKSRIATDATSTLKTDLQSITGSYRVYALAMPEVNILASGDRITTIAAQLNAIQAKIQARLAADTTLTGNTVITADLADMSAKVADAMTNTRAAAAEVTPLMPDQGDKVKMASNLAALKDARSKIKAAADDLKAARKDVQAILDIIKKSEKGTKKTTATSATSTP
jgi:hypothetical protein